MDRVFRAPHRPREVTSYLAHTLVPPAEGSVVTAAEGLTVTQRVSALLANTHYGDLVDGAYVLALFGDVATEACIRMERDEGLFASYSDVQFPAPVLGGDVIEAMVTVTQFAPQPQPGLRGPRRVPSEPRTRAVGIGRARTSRSPSSRPPAPSSFRHLQADPVDGE